MKKRNSVTLLAADVPDSGGRGRTTMMVVVTDSISNLNDSSSFDSAGTCSSKSSSSHTLQVPDLDNLFDLRRRSLSSLSENYSGLTSIRRSSAPPSSVGASVRRASCGWGPIWELRKQFLPHKRRLSASSGEHQVGPTILE